MSIRPSRRPPTDKQSRRWERSWNWLVLTAVAVVAFALGNLWTEGGGRLNLQLLLVLGWSVFALASAILPRFRPFRGNGTFGIAATLMTIGGLLMLLSYAIAPQSLISSFRIAALVLVCGGLFVMIFDVAARFRPDGPSGK